MDKLTLEIGMLLTIGLEGVYYIVGIDGDRVLYRPFYDEIINGVYTIVVNGSERVLYLDEYEENPEITAESLNDGVKVIREY